MAETRGLREQHCLKAVQYANYPPLSQEQGPTCTFDLAMLDQRLLSFIIFCVSP